MGIDRYPFLSEMFHPFFASLRAQCERDLRFKSLVHYLLNNIFFCLLLKQLAFILITGRNEVVAKVIFLHLSVIHSVHRGGSASVHAGIPPPRTRQTPPDQADPPGTRQTPPGPGRHPPGTRQTPPGPGRHPPPPPQADSSIRSTSGRYASCWNAFLF